MLVVIDAKINKITVDDVKKMISDCEVHKCHGIMVINQRTIIEKDLIEELEAKGISVVRVKYDNGKIYNTSQNQELIIKIVEDIMLPIE
jgi:hypothetical protein